MDGTLHQVFVMASDFEESVSFYDDVLGLSTVEREDDRAVFDTGQCSLVVEPEFPAEELAAFGLEPPGEDRGAGIVVVVEVEDVEAVNDRAEAAGADVRAGPVEVDWGRKLLLVADPDGYVLEISRPLETA